MRLTEVQALMLMSSKVMVLTQSSVDRSALASITSTSTWPGLFLLTKYQMILML
jgi:hypothetical protein